LVLRHPGGLGNFLMFRRAIELGGKLVRGGCHVASTLALPARHDVASPELVKHGAADVLDDERIEPDRIAGITASQGCGQAQITSADQVLFEYPTR
jgi:hypothetical protein